MLGKCTWRTRVNRNLREGGRVDAHFTIQGKRLSSDSRVAFQFHQQPIESKEDLKSILNKKHINLRRTWPNQQV